ncbi:hypothetical protein DTW90_32675 [Neorhizobium sp. P12A]|nr:hypothetical protein DTW90_32675 [Neorhizobium sp. P12A]
MCPSGESGWTGKKLDCRFVGHRRKTEKLRCSSAPSRPFGTARARQLNPRERRTFHRLPSIDLAFRILQHLCRKATCTDGFHWLSARIFNRRIASAASRKPWPISTSGTPSSAISVSFSSSAASLCDL